MGYRVGPALRQVLVKNVQIKREKNLSTSSVLEAEMVSALGPNCKTIPYLFFSSLQIIEVKFEKFDVERDNYCRYDHVSIFNGGEINDARRIGKYCGDSPPA